MVEYCPLDLKLWSLFQQIDSGIIHTVQLVHVFGHEASSAYFVTSEDDVYAIGENVLGRLGIGDVLSASEPVKLDILCGKSVICFATASTHSLALTNTGEVYAWGSNRYGQIGNGTTDPQDRPCKVLLPEYVQIVQISCADRYCLALTEKNQLFQWGDVTWDCESEQSLPALLKWVYDDLRINSISCGAFHAVAVTDGGKILTWGLNEVGQLGRETEGIDEVPKIVGGQIEDQFIVKATCSTLATFALTNEGHLYIWGCNRNSVDSVGYPSENIPLPQRIINRKNIIDIASNNLDSVICVQTEDPHGFYLWAFDEKGATFEQLNCSNILEGFADRAMPVVMRKIPEELPSLVQQLTPLQGPIRDIGKALFNKTEFSDLTIQLTDGEVYVHSLIMKTFSEHFKTLLAETWSNGKTIINMTQYNPNAYRAFLKFIYTGLLEPLEGTEIIALCDIAVSYFEVDLKNLCIEMFKHCLNSQNVVQLYTLAVGNHSELVESCVHYTSQNLDSVILSEGFAALDPVLSKSLILNAVKMKCTHKS